MSVRLIASPAALIFIWGKESIMRTDKDFSLFHELPAQLVDRIFSGTSRDDITTGCNKPYHYVQPNYKSYYKLGEYIPPHQKSCLFYCLIDILSCTDSVWQLLHSYRVSYFFSYTVQYNTLAYLGHSLVNHVNRLSKVKSTPGQKINLPP